MTSKTSLKDKVALVTGASSGIGRAIAHAIAANGGKVALCARRKDRLESIAEDIRANGGEAVSIPVDLFEQAEIIKAVETTTESFGGSIDILINSAGIARQAQLIDGDSKDWQEMMNLNVLSLAIITQEALKHFPENGGQIINLCSMSGHRVPGRGGFYSATKFAVRAMTEGLRQELRLQGNLTRVSCISPGFVETELLDDYFKNSDSGMSREQAIQYPILKPEDVAEVAIHQLTAPINVDITDVLLRPTEQAV